MPLELTDKQILAEWERHGTARSAMDKRVKYYEGDHTAPEVTEYADGTPKTHRIANWIRPIVNRYVGALTAQPWDVSGDGDMTEPAEDREDIAADTYREFVRDNRLRALDVENLRQALVYGRSVELHEFTDSAIRISVDDPRNWLFFRDEFGNTVAAIRHTTVSAGQVYEGALLTEDVELFTVYDDSQIIDYRRVKNTLTQIGDFPNPYRRVPVVEWTVNKTGAAIITKDLMGQQDEYNATDSASGDDIRRAVDAMLLIQGYDGAWIDDNAKALLERRVLAVDKDGDARYISVALDVAPVASRLVRTREHIHIAGEVPDIGEIVGTTGATSGIALKLKFMPMEQRAGAMINYLESGVRDRIELINRIQGILKQPVIEDYKVSIKFSIPVERMEQWEKIAGLDGRVSKRTQLELLADIPDPDLELERIRNEGKAVAGATVEEREAVIQDAQKQAQPLMQEIIEGIAAATRKAAVTSGTPERLAAGNGSAG